MRKVVACLLLLMLLSSISTLQARAQDILSVEVVGLRNNNGRILCTIFSSADGFPGNMSRADHGTVCPIKDKKATCEFRNLKAGHYAIAIMHDEDSNGRLRTNFLGMPKEGVGVSNDAKGTLGAPRFEAARFDYAGGHKDLTIHIRYLWAPL